MAATGPQVLLIEKNSVNIEIRKKLTSLNWSPKMIRIYYLIYFIISYFAKNYQITFEILYPPLSLYIFEGYNWNSLGPFFPLHVCRCLDRGHS